MLRGPTSAPAADYTFSGSFTGTGPTYEVEGLLATKAGAPANFTELASSPTPYATTFLETLSYTVSQGGSVIGSGADVSAGGSIDQYLHVSFTDSPLGLPEFDASTQQVGDASYYFVSNNVAPDGQPAGFGNTTYNLFNYVIATTTTTYLGSTSSLIVTALPEPTGLCLTAGGLAVAGLWLRRGRVPARSSPR